jgi:AAA15 family ATPase/GTPase
VKVLEVQEAFQNRQLQTEARHLNDGLLRLLAIITNLVSDAPFLVFDEIENGVNAELVEFLVDSLVESPPQVVVTTHSPLILNYLKDETAKESMIYLYKTLAGLTRAIHFFDIPRMAKKLTMMGPGEAYGDTNLLQLNDELREGDISETRPHAVPS